MASRYPSPASADVVAFRRAIDPFFADMFAPSRSRRGSFQPAVSALPLDVYAQGDDVVVVAAVPGVEPDAIGITVEKNTVTLSGKPAQPAAESGASTWYLQELPRGSFSRKLTLPFDVDAARADATFDNGLLRLTLPKLESAKAHQIRVKASSPAEAIPAQVEASAAETETPAEDAPAAHPAE